MWTKFWRSTFAGKYIKQLLWLWIIWVVGTFGLAGTHWFDPYFQQIAPWLGYSSDSSSLRLRNVDDRTGHKIWALFCQSVAVLLLLVDLLLFLLQRYRIVKRERMSNPQPA
jgi:hypothetical protein